MLRGEERNRSGRACANGRDWSALCAVALAHGARGATRPTAWDCAPALEVHQPVCSARSRAGRHIVRRRRACGAAARHALIMSPLATRGVLHGRAALRGAAHRHCTSPAQHRARPQPRQARQASAACVHSARARAAGNDTHTRGSTCASELSVIELTLSSDVGQSLTGTPRPLMLVTKGPWLPGARPPALAAPASAAAQAHPASDRTARRRGIASSANAHARPRRLCKRVQRAWTATGGAQRCVSIDSRYWHHVIKRQRPAPAFRASAAAALSL